MDSDPPRYGAIKHPMPTEMNIPLQPQGLPITQQTAIVPYMAEIPGIPPGLEYLTQLDQVIIREKFSSGQRWERNYELCNNLSQRIFMAKQEVQCCGPLFDFHINDNNNREVVEFLQLRKCTCTSEIMFNATGLELVLELTADHMFVKPGNKRELEIHCPPGTIIGYSIYNMASAVTSFYLLNAAKQVILVIVGPSLRTSIFGDVNFEVRSNDETQTVGMIRRESGHFSVQFPLDLDVKLKFVLIGAAFFLDDRIYSERRRVTEPRSSSN